jgi:hypothetical protein
MPSEDKEDLQDMEAIAFTETITIMVIMLMETIAPQITMMPQALIQWLQRTISTSRT